MGRSKAPTYSEAMQSCNSCGLYTMAGCGLCIHTQHFYCCFHFSLNTCGRYCGCIPCRTLCPNVCMATGMHASNEVKSAIIIIFYYQPVGACKVVGYSTSQLDSVLSRFTGNPTQGCLFRPFIFGSWSIETGSHSISLRYHSLTL